MNLTSLCTQLRRSLRTATAPRAGAGALAPASDADTDRLPGAGPAHPVDQAFDRSVLHAIQDASPQGILVVDQHGHIVSYNPRFLEIWQIPLEQVRPGAAGAGAVADRPILEHVRMQTLDPDGFLRRVRELYADPDARDQCEIALEDGRTIERHSVGLRDDDGRYLGRVWFFLDITERKRTERELRELALHDSLTGLLNRGHFAELAAAELRRAQRYQRPLSVLMLDLDRFKAINDRYGHAGGDTVLKAMSRRWQDALRGADLLARIGGEEFAVLLPETGLEAARTVAERLRCATAAPLEIEGEAIVCTVSAGVAPVRNDDYSIDDVLRRADTALYRAKQLGRNRVEVAA